MMKTQVLCACLLLVVCSMVSARPQVTVPRCETAPTIDGTLSAGEWDHAAGIGCFTIIGGSLAPAQPQIMLTYGAETLYVAARLPLPEGTRPKTAAEHRDGPVWNDDTIEIFLDATGQRGKYHQIAANAAGVQMDGIGQSQAWNGQWTAATAIGATEWTLEVAIAFSELDATLPVDGRTWAANFAWDRQTPSPMIATWAPMGASLHDPARFGDLTFSADAPPAALFGPSLDADGTLSMRGRLGDGQRAELLLSGGKGEQLGAAQATGPQSEVVLLVAVPRDQGHIAPGEYRVAVAVRAGETVVMSSEAQVSVKPPLSVGVRRYWLAGGLEVDLDARNLTAVPDGLGAAVRLVAPDGATAREQKLDTLPPHRQATAEMDVAELAPGTYVVEAEALDRAGKRLYVTRVDVEKPARPAWLGSTAGISDEVLPPWTPLKATGNAVSPWGRTYSLGALPFPSSVVTRETEVLNGPITLVGSVDGQALQWSGSPCAVREARPHRVSLGGRAQAGALTCDGTVSVEYDGMMRSDFSIIPRGECTVESLALVVPIKRQYARYLYHYPGRWGSAYNAGALPREGFHSPFRPFLWLGDEWRGLCWFSESDRNFSGDADNVISIDRDGDTVNMRVNIISEPMTVSTPLDYTFGFQATPVKPMSPDVWDYRISHAGNYGIEDRPHVPPAGVKYPAAGHLSTDAGTFECWVRPRFNPQPDVARDDPGRGHLNRNLLDIDLGSGGHIGFYWNIDDRSMRAYYRQGSASYPLLLTSRSNWKEGEWHHVALTWSDATRIYLDGQLVAEKAFEGLLPGDVAKGEITIGNAPCEMDLDEVRFSSVARTSFDLTRAPEADEHTLLLDRLEGSEQQDGRLLTRPDRGAAGRLIAGGFGPGRFGKALVVGSEGVKMSYLGHLQQSGVRTICFHEHWTDVQAYPFTTHGEKLHRLVDGCHAHGLQVLLYHGYLMSDIAPEWAEYSDECLVAPRGGEYHRLPEQRSYIVCYGSAWQDFLADGLDKQMTEFDTDGVYLDGTANPWACRNTHHGCGYVKPDGSIGAVYPIFATREMMKRIYTIVKQHKPDGQVNVHQSTCMTIPTLAFATSYWDGEQFGSIDRGPNALDVLPLDAFRCEFMGHNWGVPAEFLCYNRPYTQHEALAFTLLHDVLVRGALDEQTVLWRVMDEFGRAQAVWLPYWENGRYVATDSRDVKVSIYNRPGKGLLAVVSNLATEACTARVAFDLQRLEQPAAMRATRVMRQSPLELRDGAVEVPLGPMDYEVLWLRSAGG